MMRRSSDRDAWKWTLDEYIKGVNFDIPENLRIPDDPESLLLYYNSTDDLADASFARILPDAEPKLILGAYSCKKPIPCIPHTLKF